MPMINGHFYSAFGHYSARVELMITRYRMAAANQQTQADAAAMSSAFTSAADQMSQGLSTLAVQRATARIKAAAIAKQSVDLRV